MCDHMEIPTLVTEEEQFISADAFSSANSAIYWDTLVLQGGSSSHAQPSSRGLTNWQRGSLYTKFDPLCSSNIVEEGGGEPADRLSTIFKVPMPPASSNDSFQSANGLHDESMLSTSKTSEAYSPPINGNSSINGEHNSPLLASSHPESSLYTTALDTTNSCLEETLAETAIFATVVEENGCENGDDTGNLVDQEQKGVCEHSVCTDSFLETFNQVVKISSPTKPVGVVKAHEKNSDVADEEEIENLNETLPSPPESLNVTQIQANRDIAEEEEKGSPSSHKETQPLAAEEECEEGLDRTLILTEEEIVEAISTVASSHVQLEASASSDTSVSPPPPSKKIQEKLKRIQELKDKIAQLDLEDEQSEKEWKVDIAKKEAKLNSIVVQCETKEAKISRIEANIELAAKQRDDAIEDLKELETKFAKLVEMYEETKRLSTRLVQNNSTLKKREKEQAKINNRMEQKEQVVQRMVGDCLEVMCQKYNSRFKEMEAEKEKLKLKLRMLNMEVEKGEAKLEQLEMNNGKLKALCNELVEAQGAK